MTAKIKLNAASGGGSISIQAPSSSSNNRVISLPDIADGTLVTSESTLDATKLSGALPAISGANLTGLTAGLAMVDVWDLNGVIGMGNDTETTITTKWTRANDYNGIIGSAMTVDNSTGIFTFPSTGIYSVLFHLTLYNNHNSTGRYAFARIKATTNDSAYATRSQAGGNSVASSGYVYQSLRAQYIFDVTSTSTHKLYFTAVHDAPSTINGDASADSNLHTYVMFMRLGDT